MSARALRRVLVAYSSRPPIAEYLKAAFARRDIEMRALYADQNTWFDRFVIHRVNKLAHNLRIVPKSKNFFEDHPWSHMNYRSNRLRAMIELYKPDLLFVIRGLGFRPSAYRAAAIRFGWWVESDDRLGEAMDEMPAFNWYFLINEANVDAARRAGHANTGYLSHAVDSAVFRPLPNVTKDLDYCFVGSWSEERQRFLQAAFEISKNGAVYGPKWYRKTLGSPGLRNIVKGRYIGGDALVALYNRSRIVINVTWWGAQRSGMNMRLFEVPATRTLLLTDYSQEMRHGLQPGVHVATFADLDDFKSKMRFYLRQPSEADRIAQRGMEYVRAHHTYDVMVDTIIATYARIQETLSR